jgi:enamine deaminase RidA (YjgF/YER057c/UK114 family)
LRRQQPPRRQAFVAACSITAGPAAPHSDGGTPPFTENFKMSIAARLQALGIELPPLAIPAAAYLPFVQTGSLVFISGHIAKKDGKPWVGQLGLTMTTDEGKAAARAIAIDLMGTLQAAAGGDLARVKRIVKVMSLVNSTSTFTEQHLVTNGCSELLGEIFGDAGKHARSAFGVAQIPMGACVEIELIAELA